MTTPHTPHVLENLVEQANATGKLTLSLHIQMILDRDLLTSTASSTAVHVIVPPACQHVYSQATCTQTKCTTTYQPCL